MAQQRSAKRSRSAKDLLSTHVITIRLVEYKFTTDSALLLKDDDEKQLYYQLEILHLKTEADGTTGAIVSCEAERRLGGQPDLAVVAKYFFSANFNKPERLESAVEDVTLFAVWPLFRAAFVLTLSNADTQLPHLPLYPNIHWDVEDKKKAVKTGKSKAAG